MGKGPLFFIPSLEYSKNFSYVFQKVCWANTQDLSMTTCLGFKDFENPEFSYHGRVAGNDLIRLYYTHFKQRRKPKEIINIFKFFSKYREYSYFIKTE